MNKKKTCWPVIIFVIILLLIFSLKSPIAEYQPQNGVPQFLFIEDGTNGTTIYNSTPTFNWSICSTACKYNLQIANDSAFTDIVQNITDINEVNFSAYYSENTTRISFTLPPAYELTDFKMYYCRVRAYIR